MIKNPASILLPVLCTAALLLACLPARVTAAGGARTELEGTWAQVAVELDGNKQKPSPDTLLVVTGNRYVVKSGGVVVAEATFKLDPTRKPHAIDATYATGPRKGQTVKGIYERAGEVVKFCGGGTPDQQRPAKFATRPGSGLRLSVYRRRS